MLSSPSPGLDSPIQSQRVFIRNSRVILPVQERSRTMRLATRLGLRMTNREHEDNVASDEKVVTEKKAITQIKIENDPPISVNAIMPWGCRKCADVNLFVMVATWITSLVLFYYFGLSGPFGRYTVVVQIGIPLYFTYKFITKIPNDTRN